MNNLLTLLGVVVLVVGMMASRIVGEKAFRLLDHDMKVAVVEAFTGLRMWMMAPLVALVVLLLGGQYLLKMDPVLALGGFLAAILAYFITMHIVIRNRLLKLSVPKEYLSGYMKSRWISYLSILLMLLLLLGNLWQMRQQP